MPDIDGIDAKILTVLQKNGRASLAELSAAAHRSQSPVRDRMAKLKKSGVISACRAEIAIEKLTPAAIFCVFVTLKRHRNSDFERFEKAMLHRANILECQALGGNSDYMVKVLIAKNSKVHEHIGAIFDAEVGVSSYCAYQIRRHALRMTHVPVQALLSR